MSIEGNLPGPEEAQWTPPSPEVIERTQQMLERRIERATIFPTQDLSSSPEIAPPLNIDPLIRERMTAFEGLVGKMRTKFENKRELTQDNF